jgi:soluble lytic murein transglycosylase-like protein
MALGVAFMVAQFVANGAFRGVVAAQTPLVKAAVDRQLESMVPQFDRAASHLKPAVARAGDVQKGSQLDHNGQRIDTRPAAIKILKAAALRHQLDPKLVVALSYWESGWDQSRVSVTGAVGLMQVEPPTAAEAGPALLGRPVNVADPVDNADVGTALLRQNLDQFGSTELALAAYYQGPNSLRDNGMLPDTQTYVSGILALAARLNV